MRQISNPTAVAIRPTAAAPGTPGWATSGSPGVTPATVIDPDCFNSLQAEILSVLSAAGITPDPTVDTQILQAIQKLGRIRLAGNTTFYVSPSGSDSNNGLTSGTPWLTLQHAYNALQATYDLNGFTATVQLANGTYTSGVVASGGVVGASGAASVVFNGNVGSPTSVSVAVSSAGAACYSAGAGAAFTIQNQQLSSTGSGSSNAVAVSPGGVVNVGTGTVFAACTYAHLFCVLQGSLNITGNYSITGGAQAHYSSSGALQVGGGVTITLVGTPAFSSAFCLTTTLGLVFFSATNATFTGSATGVRYVVSGNAVVSTNGAGSTYLPGNSAGSTATGGQYI